MRALVFGKVPPIQGGTSIQTACFALSLASLGIQVELVSNASETAPGYRSVFTECDKKSWSNILAKAGIKHTDISPMTGFGHIPRSECFVSRLSGCALQLHAQHPFDLAIGWYLEPYAVAASLFGAYTSVPYVVMHAGSDIGRLANHTDLRNMYQHVMRNALRVYTKRSTFDSVRHIAQHNRLVIPKSTSRSILWESGSSMSFDFFDYFEHAVKFVNWAGGNSNLAKELNPDGVVIVQYGKVGLAKGTDSLLHSLESLCGKCHFSFVTVPCGTRLGVHEYLKKISSFQRLASRTHVLPPLPPWRVPGLLRRCEIGSFLEQDFPISFHRPVVPTEMMLSNLAVVCSRQFVGLHGESMVLIPNRTCVAVDNVDDEVMLAKALLELIENSDFRRSISSRAMTAARALQVEKSTKCELAADVSEILAQLVL